MRLEKAKEAYQNQKYEAAIRILNDSNTALTRDETELKGECFHRLKKYEDAMNIWNIAIANFGDDADFYAERGVCKFHLRFKSAMDDLDKAIELDPLNGYRYACRAYVKDKIGDTEGAIADYTKANELDPGNDITLNNLGLAEEKLGHTKKARDLFKHADSIAGISHITNKYFDQNPEKSSKRIDSSDSKKSIGSELKKMVSSKEEFKSFWVEALVLLKLKKK